MLGSSHRCFETSANVPGRVAPAGGLDHALLSFQSDFDWFDLRSYDIRLIWEADGQPVSTDGNTLLSACTHPPCQGVGTREAEIP